MRQEYSIEVVTCFQYLSDFPAQVLEFRHFLRLQSGANN